MEGINLEWLLEVQKAHTDVMIGCPQTFDHTVYDKLTSPSSVIVDQGEHV